MNAARTLVTALALASVSAPAAFALDPTSPVKESETRLRKAAHDPDEVIGLRLSVGQTGRIILGAGESVLPGGLLVSDQIALGEEEWTKEDQDAEKMAANRMNGGTQGEPTCDRNMCRSVVGSAVFIMPRRELKPQTLFLRTKWCAPGGGYCEEADYAFELTTEPLTVQTADASGRAPAPPPPMYSVRFTYDGREKRAAEADRAARARERGDFARRCRSDAPPAGCPQTPEPAPPPSIPEAASIWKFARCASNPDLWPDDAWTNGRTTFLRYIGTRKLPLVYLRRSDGEPSLAQTTSEPEASHNTILVAGAPKILLLADGKRASCVVRIGTAEPGAERLTPMAVAPQPMLRTRRAAR